ncbi:MAG: PP2C family protein-serine/threonine phosphatase, partial [Roseimicrobium sp.]
RREQTPDYTNVQRDTDTQTTLQMMTEELAASYESLSTIFRFSSELGKAGDVRECTAKWLTELLKVTQTDWHVLRQFDDHDGRLTAIASSPANEPPAAILETRDAHHHPCAEVTAALTGREIWFDGRSPSHVTATLTAAFGSPVSGVAYPIYVGSQLFGVLSIGVRTGKTDFSASSMNVIHTFADFLGIQLTNDCTRAEAMQARLTNREMQVAAGIQRSLLPGKLPRLDGYSITASSQSARAVGGDFYDVLPVGSTGALFAVADVMGKGVPAAMFAAIFRSHLRSRPDLIATPSRMLAWLNQVLFADLDCVDMFVTAQLAYLDLTARTLIVSSAGHCPALLVEPGPVAYHEIRGDGPPLGIAQDAIFAEETVRPKGTFHLLLHTDGLFEVRNHLGQQLGQTTVAACFACTVNENPEAEAVRDALLALVARYQGDTPSTDDVTMLLLARH